MEKSKAEKGPWVKKRKKIRSKKERNSSILPKKEKYQIPSTISASAEDTDQGPVSQKSKLTLTLTEVLISDKSEKPASSNTYGK